MENNLNFLTDFINSDTEDLVKNQDTFDFDLMIGDINKKIEQYLELIKNKPKLVHGKEIDFSDILYVGIGNKSIPGLLVSSEITDLQGVEYSENLIQFLIDSVNLNPEIVQEIKYMKSFLHTQKLLIESYETTIANLHVELNNLFAGDFFKSLITFYKLKKKIKNN